MSLDIDEFKCLHAQDSKLVMSWKLKLKDWLSGTYTDYVTF